MNHCHNVHQSYLPRLLLDTDRFHSKIYNSEPKNFKRERTIRYRSIAIQLNANIRRYDTAISKKVVIVKMSILEPKGTLGTVIMSDKLPVEEDCYCMTVAL